VQQAVIDIGEQMKDAQTRSWQQTGQATGVGKQAGKLYISPHQLKADRVYIDYRHVPDWAPRLGTAQYNFRKFQRKRTDIIIAGGLSTKPQDALLKQRKALESLFDANRAKAMTFNKKGELDRLEGASRPASGDQWPNSSTDGKPFGRTLVLGIAWVKTSRGGFAASLSWSLQFVKDSRGHAVTRYNAITVDVAAGKADGR
jgi:hypothetical protein